MVDDLSLPISRHDHLAGELDERTQTVQMPHSISPILTLPPEITSEIFRNVVHADDDGDRPHPSRAPLLLLDICGVWRSLVPSVPALWDSLHLNIDQEHRALRPPEKMENFITTWFGRASTLPLSFTFRGTMGEAGSACLNAVLHRHAPRLRDLDLYLTCLDPIAGDIPINVFSMAPQLRALTLDGIPTSALSLPWNQLTVLIVNHITLGECLHILQAAPSLRDFDLFGLRKYESGRPHLSHSGLMTVRLHNPDSADIIPFLTLPAVQTLDIDNMWELDDNIFLPFISHSSASSREFSFGLSTPWISVRLLRLMEHLTSLELCSAQWPYRADLVRALNRTHEQGFLPQLQKLAVVGYSEEVDSDLLDALNSRCTSTDDGLARLQSFRLVWPHSPLSSASLAALWHLVAHGMHIHIGSEDFEGRERSPVANYELDEVMLSDAGTAASIPIAALLDTVKTRIQNANFENKVPGLTVVRDLVRNEGIGGVTTKRVGLEVVGLAESPSLVGLGAKPTPGDGEE
ncbi:hypothetical protein B0H10DRAFT_2226828 [Mycena sp. CBHHK59/15]|nr:hypothetical protein B0H10DRAFT_2226828 [Mycena sp. CBHHK59/15]